MFLFFFFIFGLAFTHHTHSMSWVKLFTFIFHRPTLFISHWFSCILLDILSCYLTDFSVFHRWVFDSIIEELLCMPTISFGGVMFWTATCCVRTDWVCRSPRVTLSGRFTLAYGHASFILALFFSFFSEALFFFFHICCSLRFMLVVFAFSSVDFFSSSSRYLSYPSIGL
jgi:hypothetical protein